MGTKVEIAPVGNPENSSFVTKLNEAIDTVSDEFDKVVYQDGSAGMDGDLDMGGNRLYNLPAPTTLSEPLRVQDAADAANISIADEVLRADLLSTGGDTFVGTSAGSTLRVKLAAMDAAIAAASGVGGGDLSIRSELLANTGDTMIGTENGQSLRVKLSALTSTADAATAAVAGKANDINLTRTPMHFACVGDGVTDDRANLLTALQSGFVIDGLGKTYAISAQLQPSSFKGLRNASLKWSSTAAMSVSQALLYITNLDNWFVDNCKFDMGTVENVGNNGDNFRAGLKTGNSGTTSNYSTNCRVTNNEAFGSGAGTAFELRHLRYSVVSGNFVRDRIVAENGATNDQQNGIQLDSSINLTVSDNVVTGLYMRKTSDSTLVKLYSRGFCITSLRGSSVVNNSVSFVDQGFDFSGGISMSHGTRGTVLGVPDTPNDGLGGNEDLAVVGNTATDVGSRGFKFANVCRHSTIVGNVVRRYGLEGFGFSSGSSALPDVNRNTSHLLVMGNQALDATGEQSASNRGFHIGQQPANNGWPRAIRLIGNTVAQPAGGGNLVIGFNNDVTYDGTSGLFNELKDHKSSGHSSSAQAGFARLYCRVVGTGTQSITSSTPAVVLFATETEDTTGMHSTTTNTSRITVKEAGWYRATGVLQFAANGSGYRTANVLVGGGSAHTVILNAINGTVTNVPFTTELQLSANAYVEVQADQNSGGALNVDRSNSTFSLEFIRTV